ncbi:hypothetical protein ACJJTC_019328 [Scirpophaga incertulas]
MCKLAVLCLCFVQLWGLHHAENTEEILFVKRPTLYSQIQSESNGLLFSLETTSKLSLKDLINNIKRTAINVWNSLKKLAQNTTEKVKSWIQHAKIEAERINKKIKEQLKKIASRINDLIKGIIGELDVVKECLKQEKDNIHEILKNITSDISLCISEKLKGLSKFENDIQILLTDSSFIQNVETKLSTCENPTKNTEKCLIQIKEEISEESDIIEKSILEQRLISRNFVDDILAAIVTCTTDGVVNASYIFQMKCYKL